MTPGARRAASSLVAARDRPGGRAARMRGADARELQQAAGGRSRLHAGTGVLTVEFALPDGPLSDQDEARRAFYARAFADIAAAADGVSCRRRAGHAAHGNTWAGPLQRVDRPVAAGERPPEVGWQMASRGYFRALQIPLRARAGCSTRTTPRATGRDHQPGRRGSRLPRRVRRSGHRIAMGDNEA